MKHIQHLIPRYLEGRLSPDTAARVYRHIQHCPKCIQYLEFYKMNVTEAEQMVSSLPRPDRRQMARMWQAIHHESRRGQPRPIYSRLHPVVATLVALVLLIPFFITGPYGFIQDNGPSMPPIAEVTSQPTPDSRLPLASTRHLQSTSDTQQIDTPVAATVTPTEIIGVIPVPVPPAP